MFLPKYPDNPTPPPAHTRTSTDQTPVRRALPSIALDHKAVAVVLVGGVVLTALLAAVAVTAISVAIAAVVLRFLASNANRR
ncbi:SpdD protein [Streptomyces olivochromogenes]|uniref:SpdD protein n=1 Tax=Streptomyces olivochromogenes TaxID=1963 RepID=UPI001F2DEA84|nr:SpdD protein [Streptomyces olivochromogenes]MCF3134518.1 SpdD protein [Streptomyces olivochromogenes]